MDLAILPLAITMMAGPQIMSAIIFLATTKPVKVSVASVVAVAIAATVGVLITRTLAALLGNSISLGDPSNAGSIGHIIQYLLVGLLIALAVKNYVRRETIEPPKWLGTLQSADWKTGLKTGLLLILLFPSDVIILLTVGVNLEHNAASLDAALPFIAATTLIAALPLLLLPAVPQSRTAAHATGARMDEHPQLAREHHSLRDIYRAHSLLRTRLRAPGAVPARWDRCQPSSERLERTIRSADCCHFRLKDPRLRDEREVVIQ